MTARRRFLPLLLFLIGASARGEVLEGLFVHSELGFEFGPCSSGRLLDVTGPDDVLGQLRESYARVARAPYESVYVWLDGKVREAVSGDYDGRFELKSVRLLRRRIPEDCVLPADPGADDLEYLYGMVERTPEESGLFDSEPLHRRLRALMGDDYALLLSGMRIQGPLSRAGGLLYAQGTGEQPVQAAVLLASPRHDRLTVILLTDGSMKQYAEDDKPIPLPPAVRRFLETVQEGF